MYSFGYLCGSVAIRMEFMLPSTTHISSMTKARRSQKKQRTNRHVKNERVSFNFVRGINGGNGTYDDQMIRRSGTAEIAEVPSVQKGYGNERKKLQTWHLRHLWFHRILDWANSSSHAFFTRGPTNRSQACLWFLFVCLTHLQFHVHHPKSISLPTTTI